MVLFLIRQQEKAEKGKPDETTWLPATTWGGVKVSIAWIEGDKVFAVGQEFSPGPQQLLSWGLDERGLKEKVQVVVKDQTRLTEAIRTGDADKLRTVALELLKSESRFVARAVVWDLRSAKANGLPTFRAILSDDKLLEHHDGAVSSLAKAGGADAGPELMKVLERELEYWKKIGPDLPGEWWNGAGGKVTWEEVTRLRDHYCVAHSAVIELGVLRHAEAREGVTDFREFWRSLPQLIEFKQLAEVCDDTLKALPKK